LIRLLVRLLALAMLAGAFAAAVIDGARSIAASQLSITPMGVTVYWAFPGKLSLVQSTLERIHPFLWDPILLDILLLPTWLVMSALGVGLFYLARRRPPPIGHSNRPG
jgi:hypothetical protein